MTKIEWCDETINPFVGCSKCSPGCDNCYAEKMAQRQIAMGNKAYDGVVDANGWTDQINFQPNQLEKITKWRKPRRIFIGSMTDCFHENAQSVWIFDLLDNICRLPHHTFMILTKRPDKMFRRMHHYYSVFGDQEKSCNPFSNLWLGVTVCNQQEADEKIPILLQTPAAKRFVSVEPMLEAVDLWNNNDHSHNHLYKYTILPDWVICGGETGPKARPMHPDWVRSLRDQCIDSNVPFFFKQWGAYAEKSTFFNLKTVECSGKLWIDFDPDTSVCRVGKKAAGCLIDGREWKQFPDEVS